MNQTKPWRPAAIIFTFGALLLLTLLVLLGASRAEFVPADPAPAYVDIEAVCPERIEFGLALAAGEEDPSDPLYQAYYVDKTPAISVTVIVTATGEGQPQAVASTTITLPRIPEPPLVISHSPGITPATFLYARTDLQADDTQYISGTLPQNGNVDLSTELELFLGMEVYLQFSPADAISLPFESFTFPATGTLQVDDCRIKAYLPIVKGIGLSQPYPPSDPGPADGALDQPLSLDLTWQGGDAENSVLTYEVLLEAGNPLPARQACDGLTATLCATGPLSQETRYYWQVIARNSRGLTTSGPVWMFTTGTSDLPPVEPANPTPADRAEDQPVNLLLTWDGTAPSYDVYLDEADLTPNTLVCEDVDKAECAVGPLEFESDYYWKVVAHYPDGVDTTSPVWRFYTRTSGWAIMVAEDFEGEFPDPEKWLVGDRNEHPGVYQWARRDCRSHKGDYSGWGVGGGPDGETLDCGDDYPHNAESWMIHGPFSLAFAEEAELTYMAWLNADSDWDSICHYASTNGVNFSGSCSTLASPQRTWIERRLDLGNVNNLGDLRGESKVWIAIKYESDAAGNKPEGGYIDDVVVRQFVDLEEIASHPPVTTQSLPAGDRPSGFDLAP